MLRRIAYWGFDFLKGSPVRRHLQELKDAFRDPDATLALNRQRVRALIDHACNTTDYYRQFLGAKELSEFPILQKRTIKERYDEFLSSAYEKASLVTVGTSGSYGTPLTFYLTQEKKARQQAEVIYFSGWAGYRLGDKHANIRLGDKNRFTLFMQNQVLINPMTLDEEWLAKQRQILLHKGIKVIIGFTAVIGALAEYCQAEGDTPHSFRLKAVITAGEAQSDRLCATVRQVFGCLALSRYSTEKLGVLAHKCSDASCYHLNVAGYITEVLSLDSDRAVSPGELGRVVVTDLFSRAMPLIRYDTGDQVVLGDSCSCGLPGLTLQKIEGRVIEEIAGVDGQRIPAAVISAAVKGLQDIVQYQFVQKRAKFYEMKLCTLSSFRQEELMRGRLLDILGAGAELKLSYVEQIPPLPSGKRPYIVNEWRQRQLVEADERKG